MSNKSETNLDLDLDLHFLPAWAQPSANVNRYANFEGGSEEREGRRRPRDDRRERRPGQPRPQGRGPESGDRSARPASDRDRDAGREGSYGWRNRDRGDSRPQRPTVPLPDLDVQFNPEPKGAEALARQIKLTGRAYPLFDIAHLVIKKPERYTVVLSVRKKADGEVVQPMFLCTLDETLWTDQAEAADHILNRYFSTFYQAEKIPTEPPKGKYTFVAQCGMSGIILGPPNYHDYQTKLMRLHADRFAHMPFEVFKARVRIVRDEAIVKQWIEEQSFRTEFACLNLPEPLKLPNREEVERHFREVHLANVVQPVETFNLTTVASRSLPCRPLQALIRRTFEEQRRFPLKVVNALSHQFASQGLHFFKVNKSVTHVCVARPQFLDLTTTAVSQGVQKIMHHIDAHPRTTRRQLIEALVPSINISQPEAVDTSAPAATTPPGETVAAAPEAVSVPPSPEVASLISDLHWLMHEGHVIEFANGILETAKRPTPKPPKPQPAKPAVTPEIASAKTATPASETVAESSVPEITIQDNMPAPAPVAEVVPNVEIQAPASAPEVAGSEPKMEPTPPAEPV
jgi:hypothetical protein